MFQTIKQNPQNSPTNTPQQPYKQQSIKNNIPTLKIQPNNIINISFNQEKKHHSRYLRYSVDSKLPDFGFKTFYQTVNFRKRKVTSRMTRQSGRVTAFTDRQFIVGTPYRSLQDQNEANSNIVPLLDSQRYRYLLKAISTVDKGKRLADLAFGHFASGRSEIVQPSNQIGENDRPIHNLRNGKEKTVRLKKYPDLDRFQGNNEQFDESLTPRVINISPEIRMIKQNKRSLSPFSPQKENPFQTIFKNKKKLHNKYWCKQIMGETHQMTPKQDQLKIQHIAKNDLAADRKMKYIKNVN